MATPIRNTLPAFPPLVAAFNDLKAQIGPGASFHMDKSERTVVSATAADLTTSLTMTNEVLNVYAFHMADLLAHKVAGVALASYAKATDLASAILRANDVKAKFNTHCGSTTHHYTADATNTVATADATDLASLIALLNAIKAAFNAHMASGPAAKSLRLVPA